MRRRLSGVCLLTVLILSAGAGTAVAQEADSYGFAASGSYDLVYHQVEDTSNVGLHVDISKALGSTVDDKRISVVGEIGVNHFFNATETSYLAGGRIPILTTDSYEPFVQVLLGAQHCNLCASTNFALQPGGGVDFHTKHAFKIRAAFDIRHVFIKDVEDYNAFRLSGGIVIPLGR